MRFRVFGFSNFIFFWVLVKFCNGTVFIKHEICWTCEIFRMEYIFFLNFHGGRKGWNCKIITLRILCRFKQYCCCWVVANYLLVSKAWIWLIKIRGYY